MHFRDPKLFPDPDSHRPERWLRGSSSSSTEAGEADADAVHPYLLTPFGHGTRMCAGRRYVEIRPKTKNPGNRISLIALI